MTAREKQAHWLVNLMCEHRLPKVILGRSFKPESSLTLGSPSILCKNLLSAAGHDVRTYDPFIDEFKPDLGPSVFLIGTKHAQFADFEFPEGSVVIDPWRFIKQRDGITYIPVGISGFDGE